MVTNPLTTEVVHENVLPDTSVSKAILAVDPEQMDLNEGELITYDTGETVTV